MNTVAELIERLSAEANTLEDLGQSEVACGFLAAIRIIKDELNPFDAIGGDSAPPAQKEDNTELVAEVAQLKAQHAALSASHSRLLSAAGSVEACRQRISELAMRKVEGMQYKSLREDVTDAEKMIAALPKCKKCRGGGQIKPLFYIQDCPDCFGTGGDFAVLDHLAIGQQALIRHQRVLLSKVLHDLYMTGLSETDKLGISMDDFYSSCKTELRLD